MAINLLFSESEMEQTPAPIKASEPWVDIEQIAGVDEVITNGTSCRSGWNFVAGISPMERGISSGNRGSTSFNFELGKSGTVIWFCGDVPQAFSE